MSVQNLNLVTSQEPGKANHTEWKLSAVCAIATEALDTLSLHVVAQPGRDRVERGKEHFIATAIVPFRKLREKAAGIAILGEMQNTLHKK